jgi:hypothetical protein
MSARITLPLPYKYNNELEACQVGFEVVTAVVMKGSIFWDMPPRNVLEVNQ